MYKYIHFLFYYIVEIQLEITKKYLPFLECNCNPDGTQPNTYCERYANSTLGKIAGQCHCKQNVEGQKCDVCKPNFWNLANPDGCDPCDCSTLGSKELQCDRNSGQCPCFGLNYQGLRCDQCAPGFRKFPKCEGIPG